MVSNIGPLPACRPVIYYTPFSAGGQMVSNIGLLTVCRPMIYYRPFSAGGPMVGNICPLTACRPMIYYNAGRQVYFPSLLHFSSSAHRCCSFSFKYCHSASCTSFPMSVFMAGTHPV